MLGAIEYFEWDGGLREDHYKGRRLELKKALLAIHTYGLELSRALLSAPESIPGLYLHGPTDPNRLEDRVATFSFRLQDLHPRKVAEQLAEQEIYIWDGNYVTERVGVADSGGMVRVRAAHYNTLEEVERLEDALLKISVG